MLDALERALRDADADGGGAREAHHVDVGMRGEAVAESGAAAAHHVEDPLWEARAVEGVGEQAGRERRVLAGLENDGAAHQDGGDDLLDDLAERIVPGRDAGDDADGLAVDGGVRERFLEDHAFRRLDVGAHAHVLVLAVGPGREADGCAEFGHFERDDLVVQGLEVREHGLHQADAFCEGRRAPAFERGLCGRNGAVRVGGRAVGDAGEALERGGVLDLDPGVVLRRRPFAVDVVFFKIP